MSFPWQGFLVGFVIGVACNLTVLTLGATWWWAMVLTIVCATSVHPQRVP